METSHEAFWLRTWMAGEIGLAPHSYGESIKFKEFIKRVEHQLSRSPEFRQFFASFSPLDSEFCIKETCPDNGTLGTACPFPNSFTFLSTNRRIFYTSQDYIQLSDIAKCEIMQTGKRASGVTITKNDNTTVTLEFKIKNVPVRYAELFWDHILNRSRIAKDNGDTPALHAALTKYKETGVLEKPPMPSGAILAGIVAGAFAFFTMAHGNHSDFGASLIIGVGAACFGFFMAQQWARSQGQPGRRKQ